eukprot:6200937-Pleurochrysis_carterae.AAC.2
MLGYIQKVGSTMKTFDTMCCYAHYPISVARGRTFERFECPCCGYKPTEMKWRADMAKFNKLSDEDQEIKRKEHNEVGVKEQF